MKRPKVFRCYRCGELRNGKPALELTLFPGGARELCTACLAESQGNVTHAPDCDLDEDCACSVEALA